MTIASISGRMMEYSPVGSKRITTAVIGAREAPAKTAAMPTSAYAPTDPAEGGAQHRPDEQARREHAARAADADGQAGGDHLADEQGEQEPDRVFPLLGALRDGIARAHISGRAS
ncbi:hypothetical protein GCM10010277_85470 [Streptomyces longisporoflavus]|nr:hypothetical protein GCM10010277_85470 [Streptomyces longisporoflavus]